LLAFLSNPFVIAIAVGVVCTVAAGVGFYYLGRHTHSIEKEQDFLKRELKIKEQEVRKAASQLAKQTSQEIKELNRQAREQREHIKIGAIKLDTNISQVGEAAIKLTQTSTELNNTSQYAQEEINHLTTELNNLKNELSILNQELKTTKDSLVKKESSLHQITTSLEDIQQSLQSNTVLKINEINTINQQLNETQHLLNASHQTDFTKDLEISKLRTDNQRMASTIQKLEITIDHFQKECKSLSTIHQQQLNEITKLNDENRTLSQTITSLSDFLEERQESLTYSRTTSHRGPRLFN